MQGCDVLVKTLLCLQATETHKDAQLLLSSVMTVHPAREAAGRDNLHDMNSWLRQPCWLDVLSQLLHNYPGHASRQQPWGAWWNGEHRAGRAWILAGKELVCV